MSRLKLYPGGAVTQGTSKSTAVTLNRPVGQITMHNAALASSTSVGFTLNNSVIDADDIVMVCIQSGATAASYQVCVDNIAAGLCKVHLRNTSGGSLGEAVVIGFAVIKNFPG